MQFNEECGQIIQYLATNNWSHLPHKKLSRTYRKRITNKLRNRLKKKKYKLIGGNYC